MNKFLRIFVIVMLVNTNNTNAMECNLEFGKKLEQYFVAKNISSIYSLYNMEGVDEFIKKSIENAFIRNFNQVIETVKIEDVKTDLKLDFERDGIKYSINTSPTKELTIVFKQSKTQKENGHSAAMSVYLGVEGGVCKIGTAARVKTK